jgi:hypothetical protein
MSRRPNIVSRHEKKVERRIQIARRERDRAMARPAPALHAGFDEPSTTCIGRGAPAAPIPKAVQAWIDAESREQLKRYRKIAREMNALAPERERWVAEFYERITGPRGFSVHAGTRRTIGRDELPARPDRPWRVVW